NFGLIDRPGPYFAGDPEVAGKELEGKIWSRAIDQSEIQYYRDVYRVISTQLKSGKLHIRILQEDSQPQDGFVPAAPNLEDVYFSNIATRVDVNTM
ncbi:MAG TPA: ABC transporter ATP-binding protein, partial [Mucilaginibacter sp.]|nr:ABC transporter ATP-binding protein [Mucilaginibacter sp.]